MFQSSNRILSLVTKPVFEDMQPHFKTAQLTMGDVLAETGNPVTRVYFPHSGVISLVVEMASAGQMIETAMVGRDGVFNAAAALDGKVSLNKALVQLAGVSSMIDGDRLAAIANEHKSLRSLLLLHEQVLFAQSQQSAGCNASHAVEASMCRWLLRMRDLAGSDELILTQEILSQMLGVTRPSVSLVANTLQRAGFIKYRRGNIRILNAEGLEEGSCECYGAVKKHYERLLVPQ